MEADEDFYPFSVAVVHQIDLFHSPERLETTSLDQKK
jgi:hypothetical protein